MCCPGMIKPNQTFDLEVKIWFLHKSNNKQTLINESDNMDEKVFKPWEVCFIVHKIILQKGSEFTAKACGRDRTTPGTTIKMLFLCSGTYLQIKPSHKKCSLIVSILTSLYTCRVLSTFSAALFKTTRSVIVVGSSANHPFLPQLQLNHKSAFIF